MYRICKVLNHNGVIVIDNQDKKEYVLLGKGIGFGKKVGEEMERPLECSIYSLQSTSAKGDAEKLIKSVEPEYFEMANAILNEAEARFGKIDRSILFPMADHIAFAVKRIQNGEQISNPLTDDIKVLFHAEYKIACMLREMLKKAKGIAVDDDEIGYVALHIHSALEKESVALSMQMAGAVRECVSLIEAQKGIKINIMSLSYNRLMNHVKYMVARAMTKESLKVNMNDYIRINFPESFALSKTICDHLSKALRAPLEDMEIGYLALHVERVSIEDEGVEKAEDTKQEESAEKKVVRVAAAVIFDQTGTKVFATQRGYGEWKGQWEFPGGKIEAGETAQQAVRREILEELETEIEVGEVMDTIEYDYPSFHLSMVCLKAHVISGDLVLKEASDAKWLTGDTIRSVNWLPADIALIDKIESLLKK